MRMEKNGRNSCTGNSRHVNIRYFFVQDRIAKGEMRVEYCPTLLMLADYFTKPLNGKRFRELRSVIMGHKSIYDLDPSLLHPTKERVKIWIEMCLEATATFIVQWGVLKCDYYSTTRIILLKKILGFYGMMIEIGVLLCFEINHNFKIILFVYQKGNKTNSH